MGGSEKVGVRQPILILSPVLGTPENAGVMQQICPLVGPREGRGEVANSDFVPLLGTPKNARVRQSSLILSLFHL